MSKGLMPRGARDKQARQLALIEWSANRSAGNAARTPAVPRIAIFTTLKKLEPPSFEEGFDEIEDVLAGEGEAFSATRRAR